MKKQKGYVGSVVDLYKFAKAINKEVVLIAKYEPSKYNDKIISLKDAVFLLGSIIDPKYQWLDGFNNFCKEFGFKLEYKKKDK